MRTESTIRPLLCERFDNFTRINYDVKEEERSAGMETDEKTIFYVYEMIETQNLPDDPNDLASLLTTAKYSLEEQVEILSAGTSAKILDLNKWRRECYNTAKEILGIPATLADEKKNKILQIDNYYKSSAVKEMILFGISVWYSSDERTSITRRFNAEKASGVETTTLWYGTKKFDIPIDQAISLMDQLEIYSGKCFDQTSFHKSNIYALEKLEDVQNYNFKTGYPDKIRISSFTYQKS